MENNIIFKTKIWRCSIQEVKRYLLNEGYSMILFPEYLEKEKHIQLIEESKFEVNSIIQCVDKQGVEVLYSFVVNVNIVKENGNWECKADECDVSEDKVCVDIN